MAFTSCSHNESGIPADVTPPTIKVHFSSVEITGEEVIRVSGNELYIGDKFVAEWTDNVTKNCKVQMKLDGVVIASGNVLTHSGTLTLIVTDDEGNSKSATIYLAMEEVYPEVIVLMPTVNVFGGAVLQIIDSQLLIDGEEIAKWSDKHTVTCKVSVAFSGKEIKSGELLDEAGALVITVTNDQGNSSTAEITVTNDAIYGIENLRNATLQVDKEINLLN